MWFTRKWVKRILGAAVALLAVTGAVGALLPRQHVATVGIELHQPIDSVFVKIADVYGGMTWRSDLKNVEVLSAPGAPLRWKEETGFGAVIMTREEIDPPSRLVTRIDDPDQPFGGRWIYDLESTAAGTVLTITEEGEVSNPYFRFMSRFMFGHYRTLETFAGDLARGLGESARPVRVLRRS